MATAIEVQDYKLLIDGQLVDAASGEMFETVSPATNEVVGRVAKAGPEDVDRAVAAARRAFDDGRWSRMTPVERANRMRKAARSSGANGSTSWPNWRRSTAARSS